MKFQKFKWFIRYQPQPMPNTMKFQKFLRGLCSSWTSCSWEFGLAASKWTRLSLVWLSATIVDHRTPPRRTSSAITCCAFQQNKVALQLSYGMTRDCVTVWGFEGERKNTWASTKGRKSLNQSQQKRRRFVGFFFQLNSRNSDQTREFARVHRVCSEFAQKWVYYRVDSWDWSKLVNS